MRYDACVIGAGADGLTAAIVLARAGLKTVVLERGAQIGGRCATRAFHPGFRASPFCDELPSIPPALYWSLGLAQRGVLFVPVRVADLDGTFAGQSGDARSLLAETAQLRQAALARAAAEAVAPPRRRHLFLRRAPQAEPWPGQIWSGRSLADLLGERVPDAREAALIAAAALCGRTADSSLAGSALHLLAPAMDGSGAVMGGLGALAEALEGVAREAGAEISCGLEATDVRRKGGRMAGVGLSDGSQIDSAAVISTLDIKRTFLTLFQWNDLPPAVVKQVAGFRMGGSAARVLVALEAPPLMAPELRRCVRVVSHSQTECAAALSACHAGTIPQAPPAAVRLATACDPRLAPIGAATLTVTLGCIPFRLFDGAWTKEKRDILQARALAAAEMAMPGAGARVLATQVIAPPDVEDALGASGGDLGGGEIAPDQMFAMRPFVDPDAPPSPRSPVDGLYLAGPSSAAGALGTCVSGAIAAAAVIADIRSGRVR